MEVLQTIQHFGTNYCILLILVIVEHIEPGVSEALGRGRALTWIGIKHLLK